MSLSSSGPRTKGTPKRSLRRSRSARQRPGSMILSASTGFGSRRAMISSVISAATFTPISSTFQSKPAFMPLEHGLEPRPRQMSGQEQDAFSH